MFAIGCRKCFLAANFYIWEGEPLSLIQVSNLTFAYDGSYENIFENVSFQLDTNWKLGFTGRNGRGKTTFLNLLLGKYHYQGQISASVAFSYFPYDVKDPGGLAIEVVEELCPEIPYWQLQREMNLLQLREELLYQPFETLSGGEQTKLLLAVLFLKEHNFLLIDEPTNHLDLPGRELVSRYLSGKKGFILVSHDRAFLDGCVDHILAINKTNIEVQRGNFSSWYENKCRQDAFEQAEDEKCRQEIRRLEEAARQKTQWADAAERKKTGGGPPDKLPNYRSYQAAKSAKSMARAKAIQARRQNAIEEKSKLLQNIERSDVLKLVKPAFHAKKLVELRHVSVSYGQKPVCSDVSFTISQGERIALQGANGSGKSSLLKLICGELPADSGTVYRGSGLEISYVPQNTGSLRGSFSSFSEESGIDPSLLLAILTKLDVPRAQLCKDLSMLSAGQKKKVMLARSICQPAHLYIWDEPMNYIDVISRIQLETLLLQYQPTILFVEHDKAFCQHIATRTFVL